jgi:hypothetical protein
MDTVDTVKTASPLEKRTDILFPIMLIAAIAVIVLSVLGIAAMMGWMPSSLPGSDPAAKASCINCGVVESNRVVEVQGAPAGPARPPAAYSATQSAVADGARRP